MQLELAGNLSNIQIYKTLWISDRFLGSLFDAVGAGGGGETEIGNMFEYCTIV